MPLSPWWRIDNLAALLFVAPVLESCQRTSRPPAQALNPRRLACSKASQDIMRRWSSDTLERWRCTELAVAALFVQDRQEDQACLQWP